MAKFLNTDEAYRLLQRELPEDVYPDGAPSAFYSTAEMHAVANAVSGAYRAMNQVYNNFFPQSADEQIYDWEDKVFGKRLDAALTLQERRDRIIGKLRDERSISAWDLGVIVNSYVPAGVYTQIFENCAQYGDMWIFDESEFDYNTWLGWGPVSTYFGSTGCEQAHADYASGDPAKQALIEEIRKQAYGYELRFFGYTVPADDLASMLDDLATLGPVRSTHTQIVQNANLADYFLTDPQTDVNRFSMVSCIARSSGSATGYIGYKRGP